MHATAAFPVQPRDERAATRCAPALAGAGGGGGRVGHEAEEELLRRGRVWKVHDKSPGEADRERRRLPWEGEGADQHWLERLPERQPSRGGAPREPRRRRRRRGRPAGRRRRRGGGTGGGRRRTERGARAGPRGGGRARGATGRRTRSAAGASGAGGGGCQGEQSLLGRRRKKSMSSRGCGA